jgi:ADP-ribose pyrophosphatase YjhB (NUDIX family)
MEPRRRYPDMPLVGVGAVVVEGDRVLLVQRANEPGRGMWAFPGGVLQLGETLAEAARREVREECGLEIQVGETLGVFDLILRDQAGTVQYHYVLIDLLAHPAGGKLRVSSDILDARWVTLEELDRLPVTSPRVREVAAQAIRTSESR